MCRVRQQNELLTQTKQSMSFLLWTVMHMRAIAVAGRLPASAREWPFETRDADRLRALLLREFHAEHLLWTAA